MFKNLVSITFGHAVDLQLVIYLDTFRRIDCRFFVQTLRDGLFSAVTRQSRLRRLFLALLLLAGNRLLFFRPRFAIRLGSHNIGGQRGTSTDLL